MIIVLKIKYKNMLRMIFSFFIFLYSNAKTGIVEIAKNDERKLGLPKVPKYLMLTVSHFIGSRFNNCNME